jgi:hypothetical protein
VEADAPYVLYGALGAFLTLKFISLLITMKRSSKNENQIKKIQEIKKEEVQASPDNRT